MKKALLFGAADGGRRVKQVIQEEYEIHGYIDNSLEKIGQKLDGIEIFSPQEAQKLEYDYIIISNIYGDTIKEQLMEQMHVPKEKIIDYYHNNMFDTRLGLLRASAKRIHELGIEGDVAEVGVYKGDFAKYINKYFADRKIFLFDTFEGFDKSEISIEKEKIGVKVLEHEFTDTNVEYVLSNMAYKEQCVVKKGFFPETAKDMDENKFCFVSLDTDLYEAIKNGLEFFYPKMSKGGYIFIHDYDSTRFFGVKKAVEEFCEKEGVSIVPALDLGGSAIIVK